MGTDKRRLRLWGEHGPMLLEYMVTRAARFSDDIIVALNDPEAWSGLQARLVRDEVERSGPLAGLAAGLAVCRHEYALALACDLPLVQDALIDALLAHPRPYDALARALVEPLEMVDARYLAPDIWRQYDPHGVSFINVNNPEDVERVKMIIANSPKC
jgi:molybdopterin-guanine dinucleotide biosynthesis protein A